MFDIPTDLLLDGLVVVLLGATIFFCVILDRRLKAMRSGQDGLKAIIDQLNTATARAELSIGQLKQVSGDMDAGLNERVRQAQTVMDELSVMVGSGQNLASRLDEGRFGRGRLVDDEPRAVPQEDRKIVPLDDRASLQGKLVSEQPPEKPAERLESGINKSLLDALKKAR